MLNTIRARLVPFIALTLASPVFASDIAKSPGSFSYEGAKAVPVDFKKVTLNMEFDVAAKKTHATAVIEFTTEENGFPYFDLVPEIETASIDGVVVNKENFPVVPDVDKVTDFRVLKQSLDAGDHVLELSYYLEEGVKFENDTVSAGFFMSDLKVGGRGYWEQYAPTNFEYDQYEQTLNLTVSNTEQAHRLYANGAVSTDDNRTFSVVFPGYYTTSSFYVHLVKEGRFVERSATYEGLGGRQIPVLSYAARATDADAGLRGALKVLKENETTYGPFAHAQAIAYITPDGGGMEYCGATMTSLWALEHEFTHFWFARGVMPSDGNAGWIDEAIASWRDDGYPRADAPPSGAAHNLGGFSIWRRHTTMDAYTKGADLISEFDKQFSGFQFETQRGMRGILRQLFNEAKRTTISVLFFKSFLERVTSTDLTRTFERYVYGRSNVNEDDGDDVGEGVDFSKAAKRKMNHHPRPYTAAELNLYR